MISTKRAALIAMFIAILGVSISNGDSHNENIKPNRVSREVSRLEYVMELLRKRNLLGQVDPSLLSKVKDAISTSKEDEGGEEDRREERDLSNMSYREQPQSRDIYRSSRERAINNRFSNILLDRRSGSRRDPVNRSGERSRHQQSGGASLLDLVPESDSECEILKKENAMLRQLLLGQVKSNPAGLLELTKINGENQLLDDLTSGLQGEESRPLAVIAKASRSNPLNLLFQEELTEEDPIPLQLLQSSIQEPEGPYLESVLVTPTATMTTIYETTSFTTTVTANITKEIQINYLGRKINTHIVEQEEQVETTTKTSSTVTEVLPSPTWSTYTVTPTPTPPPATTSPPPPLNPIIQSGLRASGAKPNLLNLFNDGVAVNPQALLPHLYPELYGGVRANVVEIPKSLDSFQSLQEVLRRIKEKKQSSGQEYNDAEETRIVAPLQTVSVMTVFLSGSKPGEFTTSLSTVTLTDSARKKRSSEIEMAEEIVAPTSVRQMEITRSPLLSDLDMFEAVESSLQNELEDLILQSSISGFPSDLPWNERSACALTKTVTVTINK